MLTGVAMSGRVTTAYMSAPIKDLYSLESTEGEGFALCNPVFTSFTDGTAGVLTGGELESKVECRLAMSRMYCS